MTQITAVITLTESAYAPFEISRAIVASMKKADPMIAKYALSLIDTRLTKGDSPIIAEYVTPEYATDSKGVKYMKVWAMMDKAYNFPPKTLQMMIDSAESSYEDWKANKAIERETKAQGVARATQPQRDHESSDPVIAKVDYPALANSVARTLGLVTSGVRSKYADKFAAMSDNELIACWRAFEHVELSDDSRRMSAWIAELTNRDMTKADVITLWNKIDNPPKQTRTPRKATPTESAKATPTKSAKATPVVTDESADDQLMREYAEFQAFKAMREKMNRK